MGLKKNVRRGAALLDEKRPNWARIMRLVLDHDPALFDTKSNSGCILGQLYGQFWLGLIALDLTTKETSSTVLSSRFGFTISPVYQKNHRQSTFKTDFDRLRDLWVAEVDERIPSSRRTWNDVLPENWPHNLARIMSDAPYFCYQTTTTRPTGGQYDDTNPQSETDR